MNKIRLLSSEDLKMVVEELKEHGADILVSAEDADPKLYVSGENKISTLFAKALELQYPDLDRDVIDKVEEAISIILEQPIVEIKFFPIKKDRDDFIQKKISKESRKAVFYSPTRSTNMRNVYAILDLCLNGEFDSLVNALKRLYIQQLKTSDSIIRISNAKNARELICNLCIEVIKKNS